MGSSSFTPATADAAIRDGVYDCIAFGRFLIANPDFVERVKTNSPMNVYDTKTFYSKGPKGYIDYPTMKQTGDYPTINLKKLERKLVYKNPTTRRTKKFRTFNILVFCLLKNK